MIFKKLVLLALGVSCMDAYELQKIFNHHISNDALKTDPYIELGKLVLYFDQQPIVKKRESKQISPKEIEDTYFIAQASVKNEQAKQMIHAINKVAGQQYRLKIDALEHPLRGLEIKITYDPNKVLIEYDFFEAITRAKGLEFRLFNKSLLNILQKKNEPVLRVSHVIKPQIIIDCGHGGTDTGTVGFFNTVEKDITLAIGKKLSSLLQNKGFSVILTRNNDDFISLDQRTLIANQGARGSILISLHANNAAKKEVRGLETYYLAPNLFRKEKNQLETAIDVIINNCDNQLYDKSKTLAQAVHTNILKTVKKNGYEPYDRKIKTASTQILMGSRYPGILLELDFLSNEIAAQLLQNEDYQKIMVSGIYNGIVEYCKKSY